MNLEIQIRELTDIFGELKIRNTLKKLAEIEAGRFSKKIRQVRNELLLFEERFQMTSEEAWSQFNSGKLGDDMDIMEWMGLYENLLDFQDCHNRIKNTEIKKCTC